MFIAYISSQMKVVYFGHCPISSSSSKVAKRLGRSLDGNQPLPKGIDADPECTAYVTWQGMVRWSHTLYRKKWLQKSRILNIVAIIKRWRTGMM